ncbi:MAG TPA: Gfo/Idh/MocA family oxidoreductase, partial [Chitinophagaceae bacterium]|nr:Gfo/Idh/MocA family oxidoreductase [Chitinophagaceae bacterium]
MTSTMNQFAIIGCGEVAYKHAEVINKMGKLIAVCDIIPDKANALANKFSAKAYYTIDELLLAEKEIGIAVICTPNGYHAEHSIKALQARNNVLCETPFCLTTAAAWQTIETEKFCRRKLFIIKRARLNNLFKDVKKDIEDNKLGKVYSFHFNISKY